jgi:hypothetical protein
MRGAIVTKMSIVAKTAVLLLMATCRTLGQDHDSLQIECDSLRNATPPDLVQFLNAVIPDEKNGDCVTWAIRKLGKEQYEEAIPALVRLLDFRRPLDEREKKGFYLRMQRIWEIYPAAGALSRIGKKTLPAVLEVIKSGSASSTSRENAVFVWMATYREGDEHPKGLALLKQEEINAKDGATKQRLRWAIQKAVAWCNPPEEAACREAARASAP